MTYKSPRNKDEYWKLINLYWKDILYVLNIFLPTYQKKWIDKSSLDRTMLEHLEILKSDRNPKLVRAISAAQYMIPDEFEADNYDVCRLMKMLCYDENYLIDEGE